MGKYDKYKRKEPVKNPDPIFRKGNLYFKKKDFDNAILHYREFLKLVPHNVSAHNQIGICYLQNKDYERAIQEFSQIIKLDSSFFMAYNNMGLTYIHMKNYKDAIQILKKTIQINPKYENAWYNLARAFHEMGDFQNEITHLEKVLELNPERKDVIKNLSKSYENIGNYDKAIELLEKIEGATLDIKEPQKKPTFLITRPIIRRGNFKRLKTISETIIITEIILTAHPNFTLRNGDYQIKNLEVKFKVNKNLILKIKVKVEEPEYDPRKIPESMKPIHPEIPNLVVDLINDILRQNNVPQSKFLKNTNWTSIIVNYKVKDEIIASIEYPKMR